MLTAFPDGSPCVFEGEDLTTWSRESSLDTPSGCGLRVIFAPVLPSVERKSSVLLPEVLAPSIQSSIESTLRVLNQSNSSSSLTLCPLKGVSTATWAAGFSGGLKTRTSSSSSLGPCSPSSLIIGHVCGSCLNNGLKP